MELRYLDGEASRTNLSVQERAPFGIGLQTGGGRHSVHFFHHLYPVRLFFVIKAGKVEGAMDSKVAKLLAQTDLSGFGLPLGIFHRDRDIAKGGARKTGVRGKSEDVRGLVDLTKPEIQSPNFGVFSKQHANFCVRKTLMKQGKRYDTSNRRTGNSSSRLVYYGDVPGTGRFHTGAVYRLSLP